MRLDYPRETNEENRGNSTKHIIKNSRKGKRETETQRDRDRERTLR